MVRAIAAVLGAVWLLVACGPGDGTMCDDAACLEQPFATCRPARATFTEAPGAVAYRVVGTEADGCAVRFRYLDNDDRAAETQSLTMILDSDRPLQPQVRAAVGGCLSGDREAIARHRCDGPLVATAREGGAMLPSALPALTGRPYQPPAIRAPRYLDTARVGDVARYLEHGEPPDGADTRRSLLFRTVAVGGTPPDLMVDHVDSSPARGAGTQYHVRYIQALRERFDFADFTAAEPATIAFRGRDWPGALRHAVRADGARLRFAFIPQVPAGGLVRVGVVADDGAIVPWFSLAGHGRSAALPPMAGDGMPEPRAPNAAGSVDHWAAYYNDAEALRAADQVAGWLERWRAAGEPGIDADLIRGTAWTAEMFSEAITKGARPAFDDDDRTLDQRLGFVALSGLDGPSAGFRVVRAHRERGRVRLAIVFTGRDGDTARAIYHLKRHDRWKQPGSYFALVNVAYPARDTDLHSSFRDGGTP